MTRSRLIGMAVVIGLIVITAFLYFESVNASGTANIVGFQETSDPSRIVVIIAVGRLDDIAERDVDETSEAVRVTVRKHTRPGSVPADLHYVPITVSLRSPLGTRRVLDEDGVAVRALGKYELPTASP